MKPIASPASSLGKGMTLNPAFSIARLSASYFLALLEKSNRIIRRLHLERSRQRSGLQVDECRLYSNTCCFRHRKQCAGFPARQRLASAPRIQCRQALVHPLALAWAARLLGFRTAHG